MAARTGQDAQCSSNGLGFKRRKELMQLLEGSQRLSGERTKVTNQSESDGFLADKQGQVLRTGQRDNDALPISRESIEFHICHSTLARLVNSKIMTPSLG